MEVKVVKKHFTLREQKAMERAEGIQRVYDQLVKDYRTLERQHEELKDNYTKLAQGQVLTIIDNLFDLERRLRTSYPQISKRQKKDK